MKLFVKFCIFLAVLAVIAVGAYVFTSGLRVTVSAEAVPASDMPELFAACGAQGGAEEYYFVTVKAEISSKSPFKTEWMTLTVNAGEGEETVKSDAGPEDMAAFGSDTLYITLLTKDAEASKSGRVEYYICGRYHEAGFTVAP